MADHSGTISANETWTLATSPHNITGALTINDGVVVTIQAGVSVVFQGNFTVTVNGAIAGQATAALPIVVTTSTGTTRTTSNGTFTLNAVDAGMNFDYWRFSGAGAVVIGATYAGNLSWNNTIFEDHVAAVDIRAPVTIQTMLVRRCGGAFGTIFTNAADDNVTVTGALHVDEFINTGIYNSGAPWDVTKLTLSNGPDSTYAFRNAAGNNALLDCDEFYFYNNTGYVTATAGSIKLIIREGVMRNCDTNFIATSGTAGITGSECFITADMIINQSAAVTGTVQLLNSYIAGTAGALLTEYDATADAGVVDATFNTSSTDTPAQFTNVDAVTGMRTARRSPASATVNTVVVSGEQVTVNFTPTVPCRAELWVTETGAFTGEEYCVGGKGTTWVPHFAYDQQYYQKGTAADLVSPPMGNGTYYYKLKIITPWGEAGFVGDGTGTFTINQGGGSPTATVSFPFIVVTAAGASAVTTAKLWLTGIFFAAGAASRSVLVQDQNDITIWSATSSAKQQNIGFQFNEPVRLDGLKVPTLSGGTLYLYVK